VFLIPLAVLVSQLQLGGGREVAKGTERVHVAIAVAIFLGLVSFLLPCGWGCESGRSWIGFGWARPLAGMLAP
jgi:hypothetical protein